MRKTGCADSQIAFAVRETDEGISVGKVCREMGVAERTCYRWRKKCGGPTPWEMKRLRHRYKGSGVANTLIRAMREYGKPRRIFCDSVVSKGLDPWAYANGVDSPPWNFC